MIISCQPCKAAAQLRNASAGICSAVTLNSPCCAVMYKQTQTNDRIEVSVLRIKKGSRMLQANKEVLNDLILGVIMDISKDIANAHSAKRGICDYYRAKLFFDCLKRLGKSVQIIRNVGILIGNDLFDIFILQLFILFSLFIRAFGNVCLFIRLIGLCVIQLCVLDSFYRIPHG